MIVEVLKALLVLKTTIMKLWSLVSWNGISFIDGSGNFITLDDRVADWTALQAIPKVAVNDGVLIYVVSMGAVFRYKHSIGRWIANCQVIYSAVFGPDSAPTCTIGAGTPSAPTLFPTGTINIPQYLLDSGSILKVTAQFRRHGANASIIPNIYFGTNNSAATDPSCWSATFSATDAHTLDAEFTITMTDKLKYRTQANNPANQSSSTNNGLLEKTTQINTDAANGMYFTVALPTVKNTNDTYDLLFFMIELKRT